MTVTATFRTRTGGSGVRTVRSAQEAGKIVRGGYGIRTATLRDGDLVIGKREFGHPIEGKYCWWFDAEYKY